MPAARFSRVPKLSGPILGATTPFLFSQRHQTFVVFSYRARKFSGLLENKPQA